MKIGGRSMGAPALDVGEAMVGGRPAGPGVAISGDKPPIVPKDWWPWILGAAALGAIWWLVKDDVDEEGAGVPGPFVG